jgi:Fic family protein
MPRAAGIYEKSSVTGEDVAAFVPFPLPPADPPLQLGENLQALVHGAERGLARLELAGEMVPSVEWFVYGFVRKEAVISSQIEGTQATLLDLLTMEATERLDVPKDADVAEVCNYVDAMTYARDQLQRKRGLPLSMRLLKQAHRRLMQGARGGSKQPGEIRRSQNWIGGTRPGNAVFVPPPPHRLSELLDDFERYIHTEDELPPLVRAGLLHAQFETIHPFLDGNGRLGRLLITLLLEHWAMLSQPLLYLSLFFKRNRAEYYRLLNAVRIGGDWEGWLAFFLEGVAAIADEAVTLARDLSTLVARDRQTVLNHRGVTTVGVRLFELLPVHPLITSATVVDRLGVSKVTVNKSLGLLVDAGVLDETTGHRRDRIYGYTGYLDLLRIGADLD